MIRTHKARLTLAASAATGLLLAVLFSVVVVIATQSAIRQKQTELESAMAALTGDPTHLEIDEFNESHPDMSLTIYNHGARPFLQRGPLRMAPILGFMLRNDVIAFGVERNGQRVVAGSDWRETSRGLRRLTLVLGLLWLPLTLLVGLVTWFAARSVFQPLEKLTEQASDIGGAKLSDRLSTSDQAEFGVFAQHLNKMLDRIEETVQREDQFASDAAHELRTPLAILRTRIETTLLRERTVGEYVDSHKALLAELDRLTRIVEALLRTARRVPVLVEPIDLEQVVLEVAARWQDQFVSSDVFLSTETKEVFATISNEEFLVVVDNLLDNALRFSTSGSTVCVRLQDQNGEIELSIQDEGPGIPPELGERVFDLFVRSDDSRNRSSGGAGIGLAVCKKILSSRGGAIFIRNTDSKGTTIVVTLPQSRTL